MNREIRKKEMDYSGKYFCIAPWISALIMPEGSVLPCCAMSFFSADCNLKDANLQEVWNNKNFRQIRTNMLNGKPTAACENCYKQEMADAESFRKYLNQEYDYLAYLVKETTVDGFVKTEGPKILDIRYSTICNLKCRGCGPSLSSNWMTEMKKILPERFSGPSIVNIRDSIGGKKYRRYMKAFTK